MVIQKTPRMSFFVYNRHSQMSNQKNSADEFFCIQSPFSSAEFSVRISHPGPGWEILFWSAFDPTKVGSKAQSGENRMAASFIQERFQIGTTLTAGRDSGSKSNSISQNLEDRLVKTCFWDDVPKTSSLKAQPLSIFFLIFGNKF